MKKFELSDDELNEELINSIKLEPDRFNQGINGLDEPEYHGDGEEFEDLMDLFEFMTILHFIKKFE